MITFDIRDAFYVLSGKIYCDVSQISRLPQKEQNCLVARVEDNFDGKEINYKNALDDFELGKK